MNADDLDRLRQFFGGYFHQDWDLDAPDHDGIIDRYIADTPSEATRHRLATLVDHFAMSHHDDRLLDEALGKDLWCDSLPPESLTTREWLAHIAARLRGAG